MIDVPTTVQVPDAAVVTEGWEYANQAAAEAAGWVFADTLDTGSITVGATDQVFAGSRSLKMQTTGSGSLAEFGALRVSKVYDTSDGLIAGAPYRVSIRGRMDTRSWFDVHSKMRVNGETDAIQTEGEWQLLTVDRKRHV